MPTTETIVTGNAKSKPKLHCIKQSLISQIITLDKHNSKDYQASPYTRNHNTNRILSTGPMVY